MIWLAAYEYLLAERKEAAAERDKHRKAKERRTQQTVRVTGTGLAGLFQVPDYSNLVQSAAISAGVPKIYASAAERRSLAGERDRTKQHLEDVELEVKRFRELREGVVKPKGIWPVLGVLIYASIVGIVLPVWKMATAPKDFDWQITSLAWLFISVLVALVGVMVWQAWRLSRNKS